MGMFDLDEDPEFLELKYNYGELKNEHKHIIIMLMRAYVEEYKRDVKIINLLEEVGVYFDCPSTPFGSVVESILMDENQDLCSVLCELASEGKVTFYNENNEEVEVTDVESIYKFYFE